MYILYIGLAYTMYYGYYIASVCEVSLYVFYASNYMHAKKKSQPITPEAIIPRIDYIYAYSFLHSYGVHNNNGI